MSQRTLHSHERLAAGTFALLGNINSVALGLEALELLLIEKGVLKDGEMMARLKSLVAEKREQIDATAATNPNTQEA